MTQGSIPFTKRSIQITIVEDQQSMLWQLRDKLLKKFPSCEIITCSRLKAALQLLQNTRSLYWLVDLGLPDGSGLDLIRAIRNAHDDIRILVITAFSDVDALQECLNAGANGYLDKDSYENDLDWALSSLPLGGTAVSPLLVNKWVQMLKQPADPRSSNALSTILSHREQEVLKLLYKGFTYTECANLLTISLGTVQSHIRKIYTKLGANNKLQAIDKAKTSGLIHS